MFENIVTHIDTILIIITLVGGYRLLKSDLTGIINQSHKGLKEEIKKFEEKIEATEARLMKEIRQCDGKIEATETRLMKEIKQCSGKIEATETRLMKEIKQCNGKIEATEARLNIRFDDMITSIKEVDKKTNEVSNKVSHIEGRLDQLFPPGVNKTAA